MLLVSQANNVILPEVLFLKASVFLSTICSFKEIDDVDVIDVTTWSSSDVYAYSGTNVPDTKTAKPSLRGFAGSTR